VLVLRDIAPNNTPNYAHSSEIRPDKHSGIAIDFSAEMCELSELCELSLLLH
jgi:hypothetical protein